MTKTVAFYEPSTGQILRVSTLSDAAAAVHPSPFVEVGAVDPALTLTHKVVDGAVVARAPDDPPWGGRMAPPEPSYRVQRRAAYPSIGDQLDALWKGAPEAETMRVAVAAVKARFPKPPS